MSYYHYTKPTCPEYVARKQVCDYGIELIAYSSFENSRIATFLVRRMPKFLLAEANTHRTLSRNAWSSRAVPTDKALEQVADDPYIPLWTANQKGMQGDFITDRETIDKLTKWREETARIVAARQEEERRMGVHKQDANRPLEPFIMVPWIVTLATPHHLNFFKLRTADDVHPSFRLIARKMRALWNQQKPTVVQEGGYHIPFYRDCVDVNGRSFSELSLHDQIKVCAARIARCSYNNFDGAVDFDKDFKLYDFLVESEHFSPLEHICKAHKMTPYTLLTDDSYEYWMYGNNADPKRLSGHWLQWRHIRDIEAALMSPKAE